MNMGRIRKIGKNLLALAFGLLVALVVVEVILRVHNPFESRLKGDMIVLPANKKYTIKNTDKPKIDKLVTHTKNSIGYRGSEPPENFDDHMTIIAVGGSTTECFYLSDGKDWPHILETKLKDNVKNLWINNAGLDGHSTFGHLILMEYHITKIHTPKMVLFLIGTNDVRRRDYTGTRFISISDYFKAMARYSEVLSSALNIYRVYMAKIVARVDHFQMDLPSMGTLEISEKIIRITLGYHTNEFIPYYKKRVKRLIELAKDNGIEPCLITQPCLSGNAIDDVTGANLAKVKLGKYLNGDLRWRTVQLYNTATKEVGREEGVFVIDLANEMPKSSKYFYDNFHFTNEGSKLVAEIIYKELCPHIQENFKQYVNNNRN
jgi:lysophospholipase L1-like esterase